MTRPESEDKTSRRPSPPQLAVPPPSRTTVSYSSLESTPAGGRDDYFPTAPPTVSADPSALRSPQNPSREHDPSFTSTKQEQASPSQRIQRNTSHFIESQRDIQAPGATEQIQSKLADHRKSMSAAYEVEHPSRAKDYAFNTSVTPRLARGATFDQADSQRLNSDYPETSKEGGRRLLQKSNSITAPQRHVPSPSDPPPINAIPLPSAPIVSTSQTPFSGAGINTVPNNRLRQAVVDKDPSATKAPAQDGIPATRDELQEAIENPKKPFSTRAFGTRRKLLGGRSSQIGSPTSGSPFAPSTRPGIQTNPAGTASTTATRGTQASTSEGFSLGGKHHKPSMARQTTQPPIGVAIPNTKRRREPTWSKKARERPLYSLGKPLPTHEEVQAQRVWQEQMERIKEMYPDARPPSPPPLPSQQAASAFAGGLQIDKAQLKDIIRSAIQEYKRYENSELDLDDVSAISPNASFGETTSRRDRRSTATQSPVVSPARRRFPSVTMGAKRFGLPRLDSAVVDEEDGPPLEPLHTRRRSTFGLNTGRKGSKAASIGPGPPALATNSHMSGNFTPATRTETVSTDINKRRSEGDEKGAGMPAFAQEHETEDEPSKQQDREDANYGDNGGHSIEGSTILSRDHETEGNWSEEEVTEMGSEENGMNDENLADHEEDEDDDEYPNIIAKWRVYGREPFAEFLGAFVLSVIGIGSSAQAALSSDPNIQPTGTGAASMSVNLSAPLAWGAGVAMSVYIAGGISGGHISPAITIVLAVFRGFRKLHLVYSEEWKSSDFPLICQRDQLGREFPRILQDSYLAS